VLGQGADAQLDAAQLVEVLDQRIGGDADEAGREAALRHEGPVEPSASVRTARVTLTSSVRSK
jgi:hypothetical protein